MAFCPNCGSQLQDGASYCPNCGSSVNNQPSAPQTYPTNAPQGYFNGAPRRPDPIPTGGMIAWSIITLLLCTIPGIVALVKTLGINKALTEADQQKALSSAKTWCIVGTILGVLSLIGAIAGQM